jgi:hypothetical protein
MTRCISSRPSGEKVADICESTFPMLEKVTCNHRMIVAESFNESNDDA